MRKFLFLISIAFLCLAFSFINPSGFKVLLQNKLKEYTVTNYPEKIYIQTDKPYYTAGEDIWFNTYLVNGVTHQQSLKSNIVYVELIDEKGDILAERTLFTETLSVKGDFKLPMDLKDGTYLLRAYTNYMRNQSRDFYFKKEIPIYSLYADTSQPDKIEEITELPDIRFYPEGGYLISGLNNRIAIKIKDADLNSQTIIGIIEDTEGNKITDFKTYEFGLGSFYLKPVAGKEYIAIIESEEERISYSLPTPLSNGYVMNTSISEKEVTINIETNIEDGLRNTLLLGHQRGLSAFDYIHNQDENNILLKIPKEDLIEGILNIVLFDKTKRPVAERLLYIRKKEKISVSVRKTNGNNTKLRDRVNLEIEVKDDRGSLVANTVSVSVTKADIIKPNPNSENIKTYLLLNSDLRGKVQSPNYFFTEGDSIKKSQQLDLIMLTHGWRRFTWQEILDNRTKLEFEPEEALYISGKTINSNSPYQNKRSETKLSFRQNGFYQEEQKTDNLGRFSYGPFVFHDTLSVFLQAGEDISSDKPKFDNTNIVLDIPIPRPSVIRDRIVNPFNLETQDSQVESYRNISRNQVFRNFNFDSDRELLDEVLVKGKVKTKEEIDEARRDKRTRSFAPSHRVVVSEMGMHGGGNFMELIANIPGIRIGRKQGKENETSQDFEVNLRGMKPAFYIDNVKVPLEIALTLHQADIDFIDVLNTGVSSAAYGLEAQGVIAIYSKQGKRDKVNITDKKPGSINFNSTGFYSAREFYAPDYTLVDRNRIKEDKRVSLFWKTNISSNGYISPQITFFTSDEKGSFQIEIEGITEKGIPIHTTAMLEVE